MYDKLSFASFNFFNKFKIYLKMRKLDKMLKETEKPPIMRFRNNGGTKYYGVVNKRKWAGKKRKFKEFKEILDNNKAKDLGNKTSSIENIGNTISRTSFCSVQSSKSLEQEEKRQLLIN